MEFRSEKSAQLYRKLRKCGYREELCYVIAQQYMNTDYTAGRMLGYLGCVKNPPEEELVDEMLAILSDRDRFVKKHILEESQSKINEYYYSGSEDDE